MMQGWFELTKRDCGRPIPILEGIFIGVSLNSVTDYLRDIISRNTYVKPMQTAFDISKSVVSHPRQRAVVITVTY